MTSSSKKKLSSQPFDVFNNENVLEDRYQVETSQTVKEELDLMDANEI